MDLEQNALVIGKVIENLHSLEFSLKPFLAKQAAEEFFHLLGFRQGTLPARATETGAVTPEESFDAFNNAPCADFPDQIRWSRFASSPG